MSDRTYEILLIADPNLGDPEVDALVALIEGYFQKEGGRIQKVERWGKKRLAYLVGRHREGFYVLFVVEGTGQLLREVERRLRVTEGVIRFLSVRVDDDLRKAERQKARRATEEARRRKRTAARSAASQEGIKA